MMAGWRKVLWISGVVALALLGSLTWYHDHYSMSHAASFEVGSLGSKPKVLIATQGSRFKDAVVQGLVARLRDRPAYIRVIDVSGLVGIEETDWNAIVLIHTWEYMKPEPQARAFIDRATDRRRIIDLGTSGSGDLRFEGIDALSSASTMDDVPARVAELAARVGAAIEVDYRP